jgi:hypothetical protein
MPQCMFLTDDELATLMTQGATVASGPFDSQMDCLANCGGSSSATSSSSASMTLYCGCTNCPTPACAPFVFNLTMSGWSDGGGCGGAPNCVGLNGTFPLTNTGGSSCQWTYSFDTNGGFNAGGQSYILTLTRTNSTTWTLTVSWFMTGCQIATPGRTFTVTTTDCSTAATFTGNSGIGICNTAAANVTITPA